MPERHPPITPKCPHMLHGGDYNPDQWPPEIWDEDVRLMKLAGCNAMSVGIFSWAQLEPAEGEYTFGWLDTVMDKLAENGVFVVLATPTAAHPAWMSHKYPEVLRTGVDGVRRRHSGRVNYCLSSPLYREKCRGIARRLAERYRDHPALILWHIHNEYNGACFCERCEADFRAWLRERYESLEELNQAWWTAFWGHTYTDWEQIEAPVAHGEASIQGLTLDWQRFVTEQTASLVRNEADVLHEITPDVPVTTNFMGTYDPLNYWRLAEEVDVISWDSYPFYHDRPDDWKKAVAVSFTHDINRSFKDGRPYMLMETTPSSTNWMPVMKLKRPGVHRLTCLQAVAHGSDTVQYFQWRKGRGGSEKFHGAVVDHVGHEDTRVFGEVAEVGEVLAGLDDVVGTGVEPEVALIYDWENKWAIQNSQGPRRDDKGYDAACHAHYRPFWQMGVPVDVIEQRCALDPYRLVIAPMMYLLRPGVAERIKEFVRAGGVFVTTYWSGIVNEHDQVFSGGWPGPLRPLLGVWAEEMDVLYEDEHGGVRMEENAMGLAGRYEARLYCDLLHAEGAEVLARYSEDFYAGRPALTVNRCGEGRAFYVGFCNEDAFPRDFYAALAMEMKLRRALPGELPEGVTAQLRTDGEREFVFLLNFKRQEQSVHVGQKPLTNLLTGRAVHGNFTLPPYGSAVLER